MMSDINGRLVIILHVYASVVYHRLLSELCKLKFQNGKLVESFSTLSKEVYIDVENSD
jgi:hypothetical protein